MCMSLKKEVQIESNADARFIVENSSQISALWEKVSGAKMPDSLKRFSKDPEIVDYFLNKRAGTVEGLRVSAKIDTFDAVFYELVSVRNSPRSLIVTANSFVESMVIALAEKECKRGKRISEDSQFTHSIRTLILFEKGVIPEPLFNRVEWLRKLRNDAAHNFPFNLPTEAIKRYKQLVPDTGADLYQICAHILFDVWNLAPQFFLERFCPEVAEFSRWYHEHGHKINSVSTDEIAHLALEMKLV
jgi:hypothetical protein